MTESKTYVMNGQEITLRRGKYRDEFVKVAERLRDKGSTGVLYVTELSLLLGVSTQTIWNWTLRYPDFREVVDEAFADPVEQTESMLFRRALGYTYEAEQINVVKMTDVELDDEGRPLARRDRIETVRTPYLEHVPPDVKAIEFILKNLRNDRWKDRKAVELTGKDGGPIEHKHTTGAVDRLIEVLSEKKARAIDVEPESAPAAEE